MTLILTFITMLCLSFPAYADSTDKAQEQKITPEQQNKLAKDVGIILPGMTKDEVRETFGFLEPEIWHTAEGQEVWHYKSPEEQNIYFKDNRVERVEYIPKKRHKYRPGIKVPKEI